MWGGLIFLYRVVIRPRQRKVPFGLFCCRAISLGPKRSAQVLSGAEYVKRDDVKEKSCAQAFRPCNALGAHTPLHEWRPQILSIKPIMKNSGRVLHSGRSEEISGL